MERARTVLPLAAAASVLLAVWYVAHPSEQWTVLEAVDAERDDGMSLDDGDRFRFGTILTSSIGSAEVQLGRDLRVLAPSGSRVDLPPGPGRRLGRRRLLRVHDGSIYATTGSRALGFELVVESPEARTWIRGTTFSVRRDVMGTTIALWEGRLEAESSDGEFAVRLPERMHVRFPRFGAAEPVMEPLGADETARLRALQQAGIAPETP